MAPRLVIVGAGGFAPEIAELVAATAAFRLAAFVDEERGGRHETLLGVPVLSLPEAVPLARDHVALGSIGTTRRGPFLRRIEEAGFRFTAAVHPRAHVSPSTEVGDGTAILAGCVVGAGTRLGRHVLVNRGALVGHHVIVGDLCTISPGANLGGRSRIGQGSYVGMGAVVLDGITVGTGAVVGAGAVVTKDVPDRVQVLGVPAKVTKELEVGL